MTPSVKLGGDGESFKFPTFILVIGIFVILGGVYYVTTLNGPLGSGDGVVIEEPGPPVRDLLAAEYFRDQVKDLVVQRIGQPIEGITPSTMLIAFPKLMPQDIVGVEAVGGTYRVNNGTEVLFISSRGDGVASSADGSITDNGFTTLLGNIANRYGRSVSDTKMVDEYIKILSEVPITVSFGTHVVYDVVDREVSSNLIAEHCSSMGGKVNECGSMCPRPGGEMSGGENCPAVCVVTCDLDK